MSARERGPNDLAGCATAADPPGYGTIRFVIGALLIYIGALRQDRGRR